MKIIDQDPLALPRRVADLERLVNALRSERRARATTIGDGDLVIAGGGSLIVDGGDFLLLDTDSSIVFRLGPQQYDDRGVSILREDGVVAFESRKRFSNSADQSVAIYGRNSEQLLVEEELGTGLAAPGIPMTMQPYLAASGAVATGPHGFEVTTTSTSFVTTHFVECLRQNQFMQATVAVKASDVSTSAEVQIHDTVTGALGPFLSPGWTGARPTGSTSYTVLKAGGGSPLFVQGNYMTQRRIEVRVRRTAGSGTLTVAVPYASGSTGEAY